MRGDIGGPQIVYKVYYITCIFFGYSGCMCGKTPAINLKYLRVPSIGSIRQVIELEKLFKRNACCRPPNPPLADARRGGGLTEEEPRPPGLWRSAAPFEHIAAEAAARFAIQTKRVTPNGHGAGYAIRR